MCILMNRGYSCYVLVVSRRKSFPAEGQSLKDLIRNLGISDIFFLDGFDYSGITQHNADLIYSFVRRLEPSVVIMPYWKSADNSRKNLARCALIASRGIGTILMYAVDSKDGPEYAPTLFVRLSAEVSSLKRDCEIRGIFVPSNKISIAVTNNDEFLSSEVRLGIDNSSVLGIDESSTNIVSNASNLCDLTSSHVLGSEPQIFRQHDISHKNLGGEELAKNDQKRRNQSDLVSEASDMINHDVAQTEVEAFLSHRMLLVNDEMEW